MVSKIVRILMLLSAHAMSQDSDFMLKPQENPVLLTFSEAAQRALAQNTILKKSEQKVVLAKSNSLLSLSTILPKVSAKLSHDITHEKNLGASDAARLSLVAAIPLLDVKSLFEISAKRAVLSQANEIYTHEQEQLIYEVGVLYIKALIAKALKETALEEYELYERQSLASQRRAQSRTIRELDLSRVQFMASKAHGDRVKKTLELGKALGELGRKVRTEEEFLLEPFSIESPYFEKDLKELADIANNTADIVAARKGVEAAHYSLKGAYFDFAPKISAGFDGGLQMPMQGPSDRSSELSLRIMFNLELPLFSGGASLAAIKNKRAQKTIEELNLLEKPYEKELEVRGLMTTLANLATVEMRAEQALVYAQKAKDSAERMFESHIIVEAGRDLIDAISNYGQAKNHLTTTKLEKEKAKLKLLLVLGKIREVL